MKYKKSITNCRLSTHKSSNITFLLILLYSIFSNFSCNDNKKIEELLNEEKSLRKEIDKTKETANSYKGKTSEASAGTDKSKADSDKSKADSDKAKVDTEKAKADAEKAKEREKKAKAETEKEKERAKKAAEKLEKAQAEFEKAKAETEKAQAELKKFQDEIAELEARIDRLNKANKTKKQKLEESKTEAEQASKELGAKSKTINPDEAQRLKALQQAHKITIKDISNIHAACQAVKKDGLDLQYLANNLKKEKSVVLEAVKQNGLALFFIQNDLKDDHEIRNAAISNNPIVQDLLAQRNQCAEMEVNKQSFKELSKDYEHKPKSEDRKDIDEMKEKKK